MASKSRRGDEFVIVFSHLEMLKIERLLKKAEHLPNRYLTSEENGWLSDAMDLFVPELPSGNYPIGEK